jgi:hypothetical protein
MHHLLPFLLTEITQTMESRFSHRQAHKQRETDPSVKAEHTSATIAGRSLMELLRSRQTLGTGKGLPPPLTKAG